MQKDQKRALYALRETEFLRLKRTRIGREDFESLKVIGRGAFGEVSTISNNIQLAKFDIYFVES